MRRLWVCVWARGAWSQALPLTRPCPAWQNARRACLRPWAWRRDDIIVCRMVTLNAGIMYVHAVMRRAVPGVTGPPGAAALGWRHTAPDGAELARLASTHDRELPSARLQVSRCRCRDVSCDLSSASDRFLYFRFILSAQIAQNGAPRRSRVWPWRLAFRSCRVRGHSSKVTNRRVKVPSARGPARSPDVSGALFTLVS